jgi:hypothetical protein
MAAKGRASEIDLGMISTGWSVLINEYVGIDVDAARAAFRSASATLRKFVPARNRARQKAILYR